MIQKERTLLENSIRFFNPITVKGFILIKSCLMYSLWGIGPIIHILFIQKLVLEIELGNKDNFLMVMGFYAIYNILYELLEFGTKKWGRVEINSFRKVIHQKYINAFISLNNNETEKLGTGRLIALIDKGMDIWTLSLDRFLMNFFNILITFIFTFYMIISLNTLYGVIFLVIYIILHLIGNILNSHTLKHRRNRQNNWNNYTKQLIMVIMSKFEILQTSKITNEVKKLDDISDKMYKNNLNMSPFIHTFYRLPEGFLAWSKFLIILYIGLQILDGTNTISVLVGLFGVLTLMDSAIQKSMTFFKEFTKDFTAIEKMWDFFDFTPNIVGYNTGNIFKLSNGDIHLKNIGFAYTDNNNILENFSLKIEGKKTLALVGNSGGGKTTIAKLISGYIYPNSGSIIIDNQKLSETSLKSYYKDVGYLTQDPSVFDGSILENLTYALEEKVSDDKIAEIIIQAKCEFIYDLPKGLDTQIGERGVKLSGGQKQRLAIAKIFLKDPKIIILDEPTSALDSFSEEQITKAMKNLFKNRTVIVIAHRLQTVKHAHRILVLEDGKIVEDGNHDELVKNEGKYAKMLELQSGF